MEQTSPQSSCYQGSTFPSPRSSQLMKTPKPPFSPPRRRSSLAFSSARKRASRLDISSQQESTCFEKGDLRSTKPNISRKRALASPAAQHGPSPGHVAQMQRLLQAAKTNMHLDMHVASSPASSIESRMNKDDTQSLCFDSRQLICNDANLERGRSFKDKRWRYSTAPQLLAATSLDVREPLPSPILPSFSNKSLHSNAENMEPLSSGFTSPVEVFAEPYVANELSLPPLPPSSPQGTLHIQREECDSDGMPDRNIDRSNTDLEQPLNRLKVSSDYTFEDTAMEDSPIVSYLKRRSGGSTIAVVASDAQQSPEHRIYLPESAEAAAESAKAKRKLLKETHQFANDEQLQNAPESRDFDLGLRQIGGVICPDLSIHHAGPVIMCPDPNAHDLIVPPKDVADNTIPQLISRRPIQYRSEFAVLPLPSPRLQPMRSRATATGSPMPFTRSKSRPTSPESPMFLSPQPPILSQLPASGTHLSHGIRLPVPPIQEHFRPNWYHGEESLRRSDAPVYSFSTAASKAVGSDQAPDSRIRDSYKTDTLTALAMPPNRFRKNGIGATMSVRGVGRCYSRPQSRNRPATSGTRPGSRNTIRTFDDIRFRSSPPRSIDNYRLEYFRRQRGVDDPMHFVIAEDVSDQRASCNQSRDHREEEVMKIDETFHSAAKQSMLPKQSPEMMQIDKRAVRELSPNVAIFRKGTQGALATRKPRRPSYWDDDLREVRESPAGRGGVNSPVSAQQSMKAEFENVSITNEEIVIDENDLVGEVDRAGEELEKMLSDMPPPSTTLPSATETHSYQEEDNTT